MFIKAFETSSHFFQDILYNRVVIRCSYGPSNKFKNNKVVSSSKVSISKFYKLASILLNLLKCLDIDVGNESAFFSNRDCYLCYSHILNLQLLPKVNCYSFIHHEILLVFH